MSILSDYASAFDAHTREVISGAEQKPAEKKAPDRPLTALDYFGALFRIACVFLFSGLLVGVWYSWILYEVSIPAWKSVLEGWAWKKFSIWNNRTGGTGAVHKSTLLWSLGLTLAAVAVLERQLPKETLPTLCKMLGALFQLVGLVGAALCMCGGGLRSMEYGKEWSS